MNKSQLIDTLAARFEGNRKAAAHALDSVLDTITREVAKGEKVAITGFGSFEKKVRDARWVRNPSTGQRIKAKKKAVPNFKAGAQLKDVVSGAKKLPGCQDRDETADPRGVDDPVGHEPRHQREAGRQRDPGHRPCERGDLAPRRRGEHGSAQRAEHSKRLQCQGHNGKRIVTNPASYGF